jgi:hypothetical protein
MLTVQVKHARRPWCSSGNCAISRETKAIQINPTCDSRPPGYCPPSLLSNIWHSLSWAPAYFWQRAVRRSRNVRPAHLIIAMVDHFEPSFVPNAPKGTLATVADQETRLKHWCRRYPVVADSWRDHDGMPFRHTYFSPAEQYHEQIIGRLAEHCRKGWGEIEIHLHHGVNEPDTAKNTRRILEEFRSVLVRHGGLSKLDGGEAPRYAFAHGNWALANSANGRCCGVDSEMQILAETGCYADFTLPSAPDPTQIGKINALYECALPLSRRAPHRYGHDLTVGNRPTVFPLIMQGPLLLTLLRGNRRCLCARVENGGLMKNDPPTMERTKLWRKASITVRGRPNWLFIKLHGHGMDPRDEAVMLGEPMKRFYQELIEGSAGGREYQVHFVTAREMVNIALAACDGCDGNPGNYREYRLKLITALESQPRE